jgi:imidazole glycerol phosphate synthase subunit HisF
VRLEQGDFARERVHGDDPLDVARRFVDEGARWLHVVDLDAARGGGDNRPVIASGGVGRLDHLADGVLVGGADAVLAASIFHFGEFSVAQAKAAMAARGVAVRPASVA